MYARGDDVVSMPVRPDTSTEDSELPQAAGNAALNRISLYLDDDSDSYLEAVRAAGRHARPRVDATRSAVVRLAVRRLAGQLDIAEVLAELQRNAEGHEGPGRKRR